MDKWLDQFSNRGKMVWERLLMVKSWDPQTVYKAIYCIFRNLNPRTVISFPKIYTWFRLACQITITLISQTKNQQTVSISHFSIERIWSLLTCICYLLPVPISPKGDGNTWPSWNIYKMLSILWGRSRSREDLPKLKVK